MRYILIFWAIPMGFIWSWYFLSANDLSFGIMYLSRPFHDLVFNIYGSILGIDPASIPPLLARACVVDTFLIMGILAFRRRKEIKEWWQTRNVQPVAASADNLDNLSSAP